MDISKILRKVSYNGTKFTLKAPQLNTPTITKSTTTFTLTNPSSNGSYVKGYRVYIDGVLDRDITQTISGGSSITLDLASDMSKYVGTHTLTASVTAGDDFLESKQSSSISFTIYSVNETLTNITNSGSKYVYENGSYIGDLIPNTGYYLPTSIKLSMGEEDLSLSNWNDETGRISIVKVTGDITLEATGSSVNQLRTPWITFEEPKLSVRSVKNATNYNVYLGNNIIWTKQTSTDNYDFSNVTTVTTQQFALNSEGYYESQCQKVSSGWSLCKLVFNLESTKSITLHCISEGESSYDYGIIGNLNQTLSSSAADDGATGSTLVKKNFKGAASKNVVDVVFDSVSNGDFIMCKYRKDSSRDTGNDSLQFKVDLGEEEIVIEDVTQYTGDAYGINTFKAQATNSKGTYAASNFSNEVEYTIPLLKLSISETTLTISHFIEGVTGVEIYANDSKLSTLTRTTEESLTYDLSTLEANLFYKIYAVATGEGINTNKSNIVNYGGDPVFANNTWEAIHNISDVIRTLTQTGDELYTYIQTTYGWQVGDTKTVTLTNGDTYTCRIIDFNDSVDENGKANGIRLEFVELYKTTAQMNSSNTNAGGFISSKMFTETLPSIFNLFPDDIKPYVRKTHIMRHGGSNDSSGQTEFTADTELFLYSEYEIFGSTNYAYQEGVWLKYWKEHNSSEYRKKTRLGQTSPDWWWLSSANRGGSGGFADVGSDGVLSNYTASNRGGVGVCLSI